MDIASFGASIALCLLIVVITCLTALLFIYVPVKILMHVRKKFRELSPIYILDITFGLIIIGMFSISLSLSTVSLSLPIVILFYYILAMVFGYTDKNLIGKPYTIENKKHTQNTIIDIDVPNNTSMSIDFTKEKIIIKKKDIYDPPI